jgi:hypothetical protein
MPDHADPIELLLDELLPKLRGFDTLGRRWFTDLRLDDMAPRVVGEPMPVLH